ncbi:MAG: hypothetical protein HC875_35845 [Anaerolineales bacterium]|nr:hypothetical protein [Anaerolineales bacterium]
MLNRNDDPRFVQLIKALDAGWEIDQPVLIRSTWRTATESSGTYHFVLRQKAHDKTTLLSLPPSPELLAFLADHKINITTF